EHYRWNTSINKAVFIELSPISQPGWMIGGIHSFKTPEMVVTYLTKVIDILPAATYVLGTVYNWGMIYDHMNGYRAEYASVRSLDKFWMTEIQQVKLHSLRKKYKCITT
ncbi:MAG TPA: hypothetical protein VEP90_29840, partial [Methylomirabilota bacterium]|nr:hypothetical protein [Methylomirabilota bacterium]